MVGRESHFYTRHWESFSAVLQNIAKEMVQKQGRYGYLKIMTIRLVPASENSWRQELLHSRTAGTERVKGSGEDGEEWGGG